MMNIAAPRKKSRRGSRRWSGACTIGATAGLNGKVAPLKSAQPRRNRHEGQITLDQRDRLLAPDREDGDGRKPHRAGLFEQHAPIAIGIDPERRDKVKEDRAAHDAEREKRAQRLQRTVEEQDRRSKLGRASADAHDLLIAVKAEPIGEDGKEPYAALVAGEFELQIPDEDESDPSRERPGEPFHDAV